jgi:hypothetical protein
VNVTRDILDVFFLQKSYEQTEDLTYYIELIYWDELELRIAFNFTNPLLVSKGLVYDMVVIKI